MRGEWQGERYVIRPVQTGNSMLNNMRYCVP